MGKCANQTSFDDIGKFIFVDEKPKKADLILIPGAPIKELGEHGAELWKKGYAPLILVTGKYYMTYESLQDEFDRYSASSPDSLGAETEAEYLTKIITGLGVSKDSIIQEQNSRNTFENAIFSRRMLETEERLKGVKSIILCCQAFHARRALMTFQSELRDKNITVCPVVTRGISIETWMDTPKSYKLVLSELSKCGEYFKAERMYDIR